MNKPLDFQSIFEESKKSPVFQKELAVLEFTEDLVERMAHERISRAELARRIGCSSAYVTKFLRGSTNFTLDSMVRIAAALGCELRTHLQSAGAQTRWFDVLESERLPECAFQNSGELKEALGLYKPCQKSPIRKDDDDSLSTAA